MNRFLELFSKYNRREQTILLAGAVSIVLYVLWVGVLAPLKESQAAHQNMNTATTAALSRVKILAAQITQSRSDDAKAAQGDSNNISQLIDTSLRARGLSMSGFQPGTKGEVRVRLDNVAYSPVMEWLYDIEYKHDISIRDLSLTVSSAPGHVTVNVRLHKN